MKRILALLLSLCALLGCFCFPASAADAGWPKVATWQNQFRDVPANAWYADSVRSAYEYGIMTGTSDTAFNPGGNITFGEAVALAARLASYYADDPIPEAPSNPWYQKYADMLYKYGILVEGSSYPYTELINRADFARLIVCVIPSGSMSVINDSIQLGMIPDLSTGSDFYDALFALAGGHILDEDDMEYFDSMPILTPASDKGDPYYMDRYDSIYAAYQWGILTGNDSYGTFTPRSNITRAEVAALMCRVCVPSLRKHITFQRQPANLVPVTKLANLPSVAKKASSSQMAEAYEFAKVVAEPLAHLSLKAKLYGVCMALRQFTEASVSYSMESPHYNDPYGFFILKSASCAGCTRATGMVLNMLGIPYEHVNEDGYTHQWCRVNVDGTWWICDAYGLYCGPEPAPRQHPYF